jgi:hypothetical protein
LIPPRTFLIPAIFVALALLGAPRTVEATPKIEVEISSADVHMDEKVYVDAILTWSQSEGEYKFVTPEWKLDNLEYNSESPVQDAFMKNGQSWNRIKVRYNFKPLKRGRAKIFFARLGYVNIKTHATGTFAIARQFDFVVHKQHSKYLAFMNLSLVLILILVTAGACLWQLSQSAWAKALIAQFVTRRQVPTTPLEVATEIIGAAMAQVDTEVFLKKIEKAAGSQKEIAFEWAWQFKTYLLLAYGLPKTLITEQEVMTAFKKCGKAGHKDLELAEWIYDRLTMARFASKELSENEFSKIKSHLISFVTGGKKH